MIEGDELDAVQQSSPVEESAQEPTQAQVTEPEPQGAGDQVEPKQEADKLHPLDPDGDRFKQVWARAKAAEAKAAQVEAEARQEREERIR